MNRFVKRILPMALGFVVTGCANAGIDVDVQALNGADIGDPCTTERPPRGYQGESADTKEPSDDTEVIPGMPDTENDPNAFAAGRGFCLESPVYPNGYWTANCARDSDCPGDSLCQVTDCIEGAECEGLCRLPCSSDDECTKPSECVKLEPVSFCYCKSCVERE